MSEKGIVSNQSQSHGDKYFPEVSTTELLEEIKQIPTQYWSNLLQIMRLFRESVNLKCKLWLDALPLKGFEVILPEIADYEVRRELLRAGKLSGIKRLDQLKTAITYLPITTEAMLLAAQLWQRQDA